jgi:hypothetical protein
MDPNATLFRLMSITRKKGLIGLAVLCVTIPVMLVAQAAEKKTLGGDVGSEDIRWRRAPTAY